MTTFWASNDHLNYRTEDCVQTNARKWVQVAIKRMSARFIEFGGGPAIMTNQHHFTISAFKEKCLIRAQCKTFTYQSITVNRREKLNCLSFQHFLGFHPFEELNHSSPRKVPFLESVIFLLLIIYLRNSWSLFGSIMHFVKSLPTICLLDSNISIICYILSCSFQELCRFRSINTNITIITQFK